MEGVDDLAAARRGQRRLHVERVDDLVAERGHLGVTDVEPDLGERLGDAIEQADRIGAADLDHRGVRRAVVVDAHVALHGFGRLHLAPAVRARPLGEAGLDRQLPGEGAVEIVGHLVPHDLTVIGHGDAELVGGHAETARPLVVGMRFSGDDGEAVQADDAGGAAEQAGSVGCHDGDAVAVVDHLHEPLGHQRQNLGRREQSPRCRDSDRVVTAEHPPDLGDQLVDQLGLPRAPRRRSGGPRVGLGQRGEQFEREVVADGIGHRVDGRVVRQVAARGDLGQQQVMADELGDDRGVGRREPEARPDRRHEPDTRIGVISRVALTEVVEQCAEHEQIGAAHAFGDLGGVRRRLPQMPVDGEPVVGVALGLGPNGRPLGQQAAEQIALVERFERGYRPVPFEQQRDEIVACAGRPRRRPNGRLGGEPIERRPIDHRLMAGGRGGDVDEQRRVVRRVGRVAQMDLAVVHGDARRHRHIATKCPTRAAGQRTTDAEPALVRDPGDRAGRPGDLGHQRVGIDDRTTFGHGVLVLQGEHVASPAGDTVQFDAGGEHRLVTARQLGPVAVGVHIHARQVGERGPLQ